MKYTIEERIDIGRQVYTRELTSPEAQIKYGIGHATIDKYVKLYKQTNGISVKAQPPSSSPTKNLITHSPIPDIEAYQAMSKEELIDELIRAKANELRAKKGYEVKGVGANKEFISLNSRNTKS